MATPQSTTSHEGSDAKKLEQITFRFCSECSNMLYPKEDADAHKLQFTCRTCQYTEEAQSSCVFRNVLNNSAGETAGVTQDVGSDPTVSEALPILCLACGCLIFCDTCGEMATDVAKPQQEPTVESTNLCQFIQSWSEMEFEECDEELMDGASSPTLSDGEDATVLFDKQVCSPDDAN